MNGERIVAHMRSDVRHAKGTWLLEHSEIHPRALRGRRIYPSLLVTAAAELDLETGVYLGVDDRIFDVSDIANSRPFVAKFGGAL